MIHSAFAAQPVEPVLVVLMLVVAVEVLAEVLGAVADVRVADVDAEPRRAVVVLHPDLRLGTRQLGVVPVQSQGALRRRLGTGVAEWGQLAQLADAAVAP